MWSFLVRKLHEQHMFYGFCIWDTNSTSNFCRYKSALINIWCLLFTSSINLTNSSNMQIYIRILPFKSDRHNEVSFTSQCHLKCISFLGGFVTTQSSKMSFVVLFDFRVFPLFLSQADIFPEIQSCSKAANVFLEEI